MTRKYETFRRVRITGLWANEDVTDARAWCKKNGYCITHSRLRIMPQGRRGWPYRIIAEKPTRATT